MFKDPTEVITAYMQGTIGAPELTRLLDVYLQASEHPPEGVIGVGVISYAEAEMMKAQKSA